MMNHRPILVATLAMAILGFCALTAEANLILLQDNFDDNSLDASNWNVVTAGIPQNPKSAVEQNQQMELQGRAHLNTVQQFDPSDAVNVGGLKITGTWQYITADDFLQILTRTDGVPSGSYGETQNGIEFRAFGHNESIEIGSRGAASVSGVVSGLMPNGIGANDVFDFEITDDGSDLSITLTRQSNPSDTVTATGTSSYAPATNLISFHNRETGRRSNLDNVVVESLTIPEPATLALAAVGLLGLRRRRRAYRPVGPNRLWPTTKAVDVP